MGGRGPIPCKFGVQCHRQDCWYSHPDGRMIDVGGIAGGGHHVMGMRNDMARGIPRIGVGMMPMAMQMQPSPRMATGSGGGPASGNDCRYSYDCKRRDCHFNHPYGRAIDRDGVGGNGGMGGGNMGRHSLSRPPSNSSIGSLSRGVSEVSFGSYPPANATDDEQDLKDTWFPKARDCGCCKGFVYGCTLDICESMGQCTCSIEENDLEGSSSVSSNTPRASGVGVNGGPGFWTSARPPQAPLEATMSSASMGSQPSPSRSRGPRGKTDCRYGVTCKRSNCSFKHPQGRNMEQDGVTFADFRSSGGNTSSGSGKQIIDQDLMDTWYPDCRDCACCKGYKHGCTKPTCKEAGLCACVSAGVNVAPIAAISDATSKNSATADAKADATGECQNGSLDAGEKGVVEETGKILKEADDPSQEEPPPRSDLDAVTRKSASNNSDGLDGAANVAKSNGDKGKIPAESGIAGEQSAT